jgi:hypothetical protein
MDSAVCAKLACRRCGGKVRLAYETLPYIAAGPRVVKLQKVAVRRCSVCGDTEIDLPDARALDEFVRSLRIESTRATLRLEHADGQWRISGQTSRSG